MPSIAQLRQLAHILLLRARKELDEGDDDASEDHRMLACVIWGRMLQLRRRERGMASLSPRERRLRLLAQDKVSSSWEALRMTGTTFPKIVALAARDPPTRQKLDRWIYGGEPDQRAKKGKKAETGLASDDDEPEEENDDDDILAQVVEEEEAELRADCVVDFICNAAADDFQDDDDDDDHDADDRLSPARHFEFFSRLRHRKEMWAEIANAKKAEAADKQSYDAQYKMIRDLEDCDRVARNRARIAEFLVGRTDTPEDVKRKAKEILAERTRDAIRVVEGFR
ncbi:hypothetical protein JCM5296_007596 [Sporobolomyces johnsonii]